MSKHRFFVAPEALAGPAIELRGDLAHRIGRVLRIAPGQAIYLLDGSGREVEAEVSEVRRDLVLARSLSTRFPGTEPRTTVTLCQALLPGERFDLVLEKGTELGVSRFLPLISERGTVLPARDEAGGERKRVRWQAIVQAAAEQSHRARLPIVEAPVPLAQALSRATGMVLMAWEESLGPLSESLARIAESRPEAVTLTVGPEGGFSAEEAGLARRSGASLVSLGPRVLRAETAAIALAALVLHAGGDLDSVVSATLA